MAEQGQPRYKTELFIPIKKDEHTFEERQKNIWQDISKDIEKDFGHSELADSSLFGGMGSRMTQRRREWDDEIERMRRDFFSLKPSENRRGSSENLLDRFSLDDIFQDDPRHGSQKRFQVGFDVSQFKPEEISVRTENNKLIVNAKHEEKSAGRNISRQFSRQVDIPSHVDPNKLACTYTQDGVLQIEAPVPAPQYNAIRENAADFQRSRSLTEQDGSQKLKMVVDVGKEYRPEEVLVKTVDNKLVVSARHEEKSAGRSSTKQFSREFDLPSNVDPNQVTATLTEEGKLVVEAPLSNYSKGSYTAPRGGAGPRIGVTIRKGPIS